MVCDVRLLFIAAVVRWEFIRAKPQSFSETRSAMNYQYFLSTASVKMTYRDIKKNIFSLCDPGYSVFFWCVCFFSPL